MANAILYNQGSHPTGALKSGTMSMNVSPSLNIGSLKWRNGFENNNMWVIYSDTYSQGQATQGNALPTIWATSTFTDAGLVGLINSLPARAGQIPFTNITAATSWLFGQGVYFLSNQNYPQIVTSGLTMMMDAGFTASFPNGTGTTWYDVCGNDNNGTLNNGPTWVNSGTTSYLSFDGGDDNVSASSINVGKNFTVSVLIRPTNTGRQLIFENSYPYITNKGFMFNIGNNGTDMFLSLGRDQQIRITSNGYVSANTWFLATATFDGTTIKIFYNGLETTYQLTDGSITTIEYDYPKIFLGKGTFDVFNGRIGYAQLYNRALSQSEILQNYYKGPIVTSGLTMALDAGNLVSYGGTGTSWKDLTANVFNGTLTNGPTYNSDSGGCIVFDGSDDMVRVTRVSPMGTSYEWTTEAWIKWSNVGYTSWMTIIDSGNYGSAANYMMWISSDTPQKVLATYDGGWQYGTIPLNANTWYHVVITKRAGTSGVQNSPVRFFVNGVFDVQRNYTYIDTFATNDLGVGLTPSNQYYPMNGKIAQAKVYNRALSDAEVAQNYNAQRGRFGI
jgi:hypothetical protein